jgi:hypothetical protein
MPDKDSVENYVQAWKPEKVTGIPSYNMLFRQSEDGEKTQSN